MTFKMPNNARDYFGNIKDLKFLFDWYYFCVMLGLAKKKIGNEEEMEKEYFMDSFPSVYLGVRDQIIALLIDAEMERRAIEPNDRDSVQKLILQLIDTFSQTRLNKQGIELLNRYAVTGMNYINDSIPRTTSLDLFLLHYYKVYRRIIEEQG
jgi:hypothetical protein